MHADSLDDSHGIFALKLDSRLRMSLISNWLGDASGDSYALMWAGVVS